MRLCMRDGSAPISPNAAFAAISASTALPPASKFATGRTDTTRQDSVEELLPVVRKSIEVIV